MTNVLETPAPGPIPAPAPAPAADAVPDGGVGLSPAVSGAAPGSVAATAMKPAEPVPAVKRPPVYFT